jgi:hypothetical protein
MNGFGAIKRLARVGFLVKGVLYMVIGALPLQLAAKAGGRVTGTRYPVTGNPAADMISMKHTTATEGEPTFTKGGKVMAVSKGALSCLLRFR